MKTMTRKLVGWVLAGGTFVTVVVTPGCIAVPGPTVTVAPTPAAEAPAETSIAAVDTESAPVVQTINTFGELNEQQLPAAAVAGGGGYQQHTFADEGADSDVAIDPTGKLIAFASTRHSEHADLYVQRVDGTAVTQLTSDAADDAFPAFSPDGRQIAFCSTRSGNWQIYLMDVDGKNVAQITNGSMQAVHPSFSPDGSRLVYSAMGGRSGQWELWTLNLNTGEKRMIGYGLFPSWSPSRDVDRIAFQRARQRGSRWFGLWTLELVDGQARKITEIAASSNAAVVAPTWSPDGQRLTFATVVDPSLPSSKQSRSQKDVWTINADGSSKQRVTDGNGQNLSPVWAVDNRIYFVSDRGGSETIWSITAPASATAYSAGGATAQRPLESPTIEPMHARRPAVAAPAVETPVAEAPVAQQAPVVKTPVVEAPAASNTAAKITESQATRDAHNAPAKSADVKADAHGSHDSHEEKTSVGSTDTHEVGH